MPQSGDEDELENSDDEGFTGDLGYECDSKKKDDGETVMKTMNANGDTWTHKIRPFTGVEIRWPKDTKNHKGA